MKEEILVSGSSPSLNQAERVLDTFISPATTFRDILRSTSWWLPFCLIALSTLGVAFAIDRQVGFEQVAETQLHLNPSQESQMASLTPDARAIQMQRMVLGYRYFTYASPMFVLLFAAFASLVLWTNFNFGLGARSSYGQIFCLWMYCSLPRILAALVTIVMLLFGSSAETFNLKEPVGTNLGYYFPDAPNWLTTLLSFFDVVGIWVVALLIVGGSIVAKVKIGQASAVVIGWWLLIILVSVAAAAAFS